MHSQALFLENFGDWERQLSSTGKICTLAKTRGLYVSEKIENHLPKDCESGDFLIGGEKALLQQCKKTRKSHIEVV
jgi:hypothetical protein